MARDYPEAPTNIAAGYYFVVAMNRLKIKVTPRPRKLKAALGLGSGPEGRIERLRQIVTELVRHERIEGSYSQLDEARGYAELVRLLTSLIRFYSCSPLLSTCLIFGCYFTEDHPLPNEIMILRLKRYLCKCSLLIIVVDTTSL